MAFEIAASRRLSYFKPYDSGYYARIGGMQGAVVRAVLPAAFRQIAPILMQSRSTRKCPSPKFLN